MKSILVFASVFFVSISIAQDPNSLLPMNNLLDINPAFAGSNGGFRVQGNYLNKWPNLSGRTVYSSLLADMALNKGKSGVAFYSNRTTVSNDLFAMNNLGAGYAHRFSVKSGDLKIVPSAQVGIVNTRLDLKALSFSDMPGSGNLIYLPGSNVEIKTSDLSRVDVQGANGVLSKIAIEVNTGVLVQIKENLSIGLASYHVNTPDIGVLGASYLPARTVLHASYNFIDGNKRLINLFGAYSFQNGQNFITAACSAIFKKHLYTLIACKVNANGFDSNTGIGWRTDVWSAMLCHNSSYLNSFGFSPSSYQLACSFNLRGKDHIHGLSALENW